MVSTLEHNKLGFVYSDYWQIDENGNKVKKVKLPMFDIAEIKQRGDFLATGTLYDKKIIESIGLYSEETKNCGLENYQLILNLLQSSYQGERVDKELFQYRIHSNNTSSQRRKNIISYGREVLAPMFSIKFQTNKFHPYELTL